MKCADFRKAINRYADNEISGASGEAMRQHVETCPACRRKLAQLDQLDRLLTASPTPDIPPDLANAIMRRARQMGTPNLHILRIPVWWIELTLPARVAAIILLALSLSVGGLMGWDAGRTKESRVARKEKDPVAQYKLDYFEEAPAGSLAQVYLALRK